MTRSVFDRFWREYFMMFFWLTWLCVPTSYRVRIFQPKTKNPRLLKVAKSIVYAVEMSNYFMLWNIWGLLTFLEPMRSFFSDSPIMLAIELLVLLGLNYLVIEKLVYTEKRLKNIIKTRSSYPIWLRKVMGVSALVLFILSGLLIFVVNFTYYWVFGEAMNEYP